MAQTSNAQRETAGAAPRLSLPQRVILAQGWTRRAIAFLAGAVGALALAPVDFWPAMFATMSVSVWLLDGAAGGGGGRPAALRAAAGAGWWLGFGYFFAGLWWLGAAMLVEPDQFAWALPLAVLGAPAGLAIFPAAGFALARLLWSAGSARVFALAAGLGACEWLRGHALTGFPWNDFGMALAAAPLVDQAAAVVGLHGLDILAVIVFAAPATLVDGDRRLAPAIAAALLLVAFLAAFGAWRLSSGATEYVAGARLRLMQPNLPQDAKFKPENGPAILRRYLELSDRAVAPGRSGIADVTHVIWPESAFPFVLSREPEALARIAAAMGEATLVTGAARVEAGARRAGDGRRAKIFNSVLAVRDGRIVAAYDKVHLVPFGEYLPLSRLLAPLGVTHLVPGVWDAGSGPRRFAAPGLPLAAPLVCYEAIFPGEAVERDGERPQWLLNVTNDGWFGATSGPYQHFAQARLRAIEEGLPLVRVANTGVSAVVDAYGRTLERLPLGVDGVIDARLPKPAPAPPFARHPRLWTTALWLLTLILALLGRVSAARRT